MVVQSERVIEQFTEDIYSSMLGFDVGFIGDSLVEQFVRGEIAAEDFANTFDQIIQRSKIASFQRQIL